MEFIATFISLLLLYTSPIDPFLQMTQYSLSYSSVSVHNLLFMVKRGCCSLSSTSLTLLGQLPMSISGNYGLGQRRGAYGNLEAFPQSYNPLDLYTQNISL